MKKTGCIISGNIMKTKILHEDSTIFVIHKPAGIAVQSARVGQMDCESELRNYLARKGESPYIGLIHRLDQPVEGVLVVARTKDVAAKLTKQLAAGSLNKKYLAVVHLEATEVPDTVVFKDYMVKDGQMARIIGSDSQTGKRETVISERYSAADDKSAKEAVLRYEILHKQDSLNLALVDIQIETGRFHQIRCQMAYHGMPLLGDVKYGSSVSVELSRELGIRQTALCANRIAFKHPVTGKLMEFEVTPENNAFSKFL